jgi:sporulation protein YunB
MQKYKKGKTKPWRRKRVFFTFLCVLITIVCVVALYIVRVINPIIVSIGEAKVKSLATKAINTAVTEVLCDGYNYDDIIEIKSDEQGNITYIRAHSLTVNKLTRDLVATSQSKLDIIGEQGIGIPIGTLLGIPIFMGKGPEIRIKLFPIGAISCSFKSEFSQAGINQTNHKIYVNVNSNVSVILPVSARNVQNTSQFLICESIIVGKVPEVYLNSNNLDEMMNLIP